MRMWTIIGGVAAALVLGAPPAMGGGFQLAPTSLLLDEVDRGGVFEVVNRRDVPVRFSVEAHAWSQTEDGEMVLRPSDDVRVYPRHLELTARGRAMVRVLARPNFGPSERTYRIVVEEEPAASARFASTSEEVRMRIAIPVFLAARAPREAARIDGVALHRDGWARFAIVNTGTVHLRPRAVEVVGFDARGDEIARAREPGWYVLPGGRLRHELDLGPAVCERLDRLEIRIDGAGDATTSRTLPAPRCR